MSIISFLFYYPSCLEALQFGLKRDEPSGFVHNEVFLMSAKEHYDRVAKKYPRMLTSGIGGQLKGREKNTLMRLLSPKSGETILDAGCGSGFYADMIRKSGAQVLCIDISPAMVEVVRTFGLDAQVHDIESLNLNMRFDKILCAGPLEFCKQPLKALQNVRRHVSEGGYIVLSVLNVSIMGLVYWFYHISHGVKITLYTLSRITNLLNQAGFDVEIVERPVSFLFAIRARPK